MPPPMDNTTDNMSLLRGTLATGRSQQRDPHATLPLGRLTVRTPAYLVPLRTRSM